MDEFPFRLLWRGMRLLGGHPPTVFRLVGLGTQYATFNVLRPPPLCPQRKPLGGGSADTSHDLWTTVALYRAGGETANRLKGGGSCRRTLLFSILPADVIARCVYP